jgi:hypothetical protein
MRAIIQRANADSADVRAFDRPAHLTGRRFPPRLQKGAPKPRMCRFSSSRNIGTCSPQCNETRRPVRSYTLVGESTHVVLPHPLTQ